MMGRADEIELGGNWRDGVVLKRDVFSTIERGHFRTADGDVDAVARRLDEVPWWSVPLALFLFRRERRALAIAGPLGMAPPLLFAGRRVLVRGWLNGVPLHIAKPFGDTGYFRSAKAALRALHRAGITHNDLAKEQNWLYDDGRAYVTDFQLASCFRRRGALFRLARYEDLRHLLKHKRRYAPAALTAAERRVLARKTWPTRIWMATGKKVYYAITRGINFTDREGRGMRFIREAPAIAARLSDAPAGARRRDRRLSRPPRRHRPLCLRRRQHRRPELRKFLNGTALEHLQVVDALPRNAEGGVRNEILELVAHEPARPDRFAGQDRRRARDRRPHRLRPPQSARPLCVLTVFSRRSGAGIARRAPDQPLPPPWRNLRRRKRVASVQTIEPRSHQRDRKKCRQRLRRQRQYCRMRRGKMTSRQIA